MDVAGLRVRTTESYRRRKSQAVDLVDRIPILGRLLGEFVRIEFIDRCMLIAAQGLLALIPMLVVIAAFFPQITAQALEQFSATTGLGGDGRQIVSGEVSASEIRSQTGWIGLVITLFSAASFARAIQRMYEKIWEQNHIGGVSGTRRCFAWLIGWIVTLQLIAGLRTFLFGNPEGIPLELFRFLSQIAVVSVTWWVTCWLLLFGRVGWRRLILGSILTGVLEVAYSRASGLVMPKYVEVNADQFGTLGIILAISSWLIGFAGILVGSALVGRVVSEDPTVLRVVAGLQRALLATWARLRGSSPSPAQGSPPG